uniref:Uncharacterized protein n=1 Tax=Helianthus annuus TaxID=4232 RepID=A0A251RYT8_HELAN
MKLCNAGTARKSHHGLYDQMESWDVKSSTSHVDHQGIEIEDRVTSEIVRNVGVCNVVNSCYIFNCK